MINDFSADAVFTAANMTENTVGNNDFGKTALDELPLGMSYVPMQKWQKLYEPDVAFGRGTIFAELDLPFLGEAASEQ